MTSPVQMHLLDPDWIQDQQAKLREAAGGEGGNRKPNPMVLKHGRGPEGKRCKSCKLIHRHTPGARTFYKCKVRGITSGPKTDHRANWPACSFWRAE